MLGNLKEFISVVQDGLTSNNNLRQTLQEVQKVTNIFKDKQKVSSESKVNYGAGGALLEKYQDQWVELHSNADKNAKAAEEVDKIILELHKVTGSRLQSANELAQSLAHLPNLTASVAQCVDSLKSVKTLLRNIEEQLVEFEDVVERSNMEKWKLDHHYHLSLYKEKKMGRTQPQDYIFLPFAVKTMGPWGSDVRLFFKHLLKWLIESTNYQRTGTYLGRRISLAMQQAGLEEIRSKLAKDNAEQNSERERRQLAELQAKRENSAVAFQVDMAKYLVSGTVPSVTSPLPNVTLEQIQLDDDQTDLEKFLAS